MVDNTAAILVLGPEEAEDNAALASDARQLGQDLARAGYVVVVTGGRGAALHAAQGALANKGTVVAVTKPDDEVSFRQKARLIAAKSVLRRMESALQIADALLVLPGDLGALAMVLQVWAYGSTRSDPYRQIVLVGKRWRAMVDALATAAQLDQRTREMLTFVDKAGESVESLRYYVQP